MGRKKKEQTVTVAYIEPVQFMAGANCFNFTGGGLKTIEIPVKDLIEIVDNDKLQELIKERTT